MDSRYGAIPDLEVPFSHPQTAGSHMLELDPVRNYTPTVRCSIAACLTLGHAARSCAAG